MLKIADREVHREREAKKQERLLQRAASISAQIRPRYRVGDRWEVAVSHRVSHVMSKSSPSQRHFPETEVLGIFSYEVIETKPELKIRVRSIEKTIGAEHIARIDPSVESIVLQYDVSLSEVEKTFELAPGVRRARSILDYFPLDFQNLLDSPTGMRTIPKLPNRLSELARSFGYSPDPGKGFWVEQKDAFGRENRYFWEKSKPWPSYLETPGGVAILIGRGEE